VAIHVKDEDIETVWRGPRLEVGGDDAGADDPTTGGDDAGADDPTTGGDDAGADDPTTGGDADTADA
jgi:hypothetical protein